jgi:hypothetical protein
VRREDLGVGGIGVIEWNAVDVKRDFQAAADGVVADAAEKRRGGAGDAGQGETQGGGEREHGGAREARRRERRAAEHVIERRELSACHADPAMFRISLAHRDNRLA